MRAIWMNGKLPRVGTPIFTFPNTPPASTTTITVPDDGCGLLPTYGSERCRLEQFAATIGASDAGSLASKLTMRIKSAAAAVAHAEQVLGRRHGHASRATLRKAGKSLAAYGKLLASKKALHPGRRDTQRTGGAARRTPRDGASPADVALASVPGRSSERLDGGQRGSGRPWLVIPSAAKRRHSPGTPCR